MSTFTTEACPLRYSFMTYNVWGDKHWPARSPSLQQVFNASRPDVLMLQETTPVIIETIGSVLPRHHSVDETEMEEAEEGWERSGVDIMWNSDLFTLVNAGFKKLGIVDHQDRGLFWIRLASKVNPSVTFLVCTVQMPESNCEEEITTGVNVRIKTTMNICKALRSILKSKEPIIFGGDFNDDFHPLRILGEEFGFIDCFESLDLVPCHTHPVRPSDYEEEMKPSRTIDWIMTVLPSNCRVLSVYVKTVRGGWPPASHHMPVISIVEFGI